MRGRLQLTKLQKGKIAAHVLQALFMFVALCILIAMFTQSGKSDGRAFWYLALCFLSLPAWIYLIMTPMWERAVRFANAFVMAGIDVLYTIFWFSAFIALAVWNNQGQKQGAKDKKVGGSGNCTTFAYGTEKKCELAKAAIGLGVVVFFLWIVTSVISIYFILRWRKGEGLPWKSAEPKTYNAPGSIEAQQKDAWSSDVNDTAENDSDDGRVTPRPAHQDEDEHTLLHSTDTEDGRHPGTPWGSVSGPPSYRSDIPEAESYGGQRDYAIPSALSPADSVAQGGYDSYRSRVQDYAGPDRR